MQKSKYLIASDHDLQWGLTVSTVGYDNVAANEPYPTRGHAEGYFFKPEKGRVLQEYQILYLVEGEGVFSSEHVKEQPLRAGDIFMLYPGEWHSYHPKPGCEWKSYWIGFRGKNMDDRVKAGFMSASKPIFHIGYSAEVVRLYRRAIQIADEEAPYHQQTLAGAVNFLVGLVYSLERNKELSRTNSYADVVNKAITLIRENLDNGETIHDFAARLGVSYSSLRKIFKEITGFSPANYQQELRLQRAMELLSTTSLTVKEIAYRLHFDTADYFSTKFKSKTGLTPSEFRRQRG